MRTAFLLLIGVLFATLTVRLAPRSRARLAAWLFVLAWLAVTAWNLITGLSHGYTLAEELPLHLVLFGVPALVAAGLARRRRMAGDPFRH